MNLPFNIILHVVLYNMMENLWSPLLLLPPSWNEIDSCVLLGRHWFSTLLSHWQGSCNLCRVLSVSKSQILFVNTSNMSLLYRKNAIDKICLCLQCSLTNNLIMPFFSCLRWIQLIWFCLMCACILFCSTGISEVSTSSFNVKGIHSIPVRTDGCNRFWMHTDDIRYWSLSVI